MFKNIRRGQVLGHFSQPTNFQPNRWCPCYMRSIFGSFSRTPSLNICSHQSATLRSRVSEHLYRNAEWIPINSGSVPDSGGPQEQSFGSGSSRTGSAFFPKTSKNSHISVVVAPIELIFWPHAWFLILRPPRWLTFFYLSIFYSVNLTQMTLTYIMLWVRTNLRPLL